MATGFSAAALQAALAALDVPAGSRYCVALSGGADSTALLKGMVDLREQQAGFGLRAIHINHHLQPHADAWAKHCAALGRRLVVPCQLLDAPVEAVRGESLEAAAREARYGLLAASLASGEFLLTAHQAEDQLETILLQLARGAGVAGLAGMPRRSVCGPGIHLRPLLDFGREELRTFVAAAGLDWIEDPSNEDPRFDRNFVRQQVLPLLLQRWPALAASAVRSAGHLASAQALLDELAQADCAGAAEGDRLRVPSLRALESARVRNLLRFWIRRHGVPLPASATLAQIEQQMLAARADAIPEVAWGNHVMRRYRDRLYLGARLPPPPGETLSWPWRAQPELSLPAGLGRLRARAAELGVAGLAGLPDTLRVSWRAGGESLRLATNRPRRELRTLMQEWDIVPWMRGRIPLLSAGQTLAAVGDLWVAAEFRAAADQPGVRIEWLEHPALD